MSWKTSLNQMTNQLASVGEKMVTTTKAVSHTKNVHHATRIALQMPVKELAMEQTDLSEAELDRLLDPADLTQGGIKQ